MERHRVTLMFIAILVCVPVLALYQFGFFPEMASWLQGRLPGLLVLPEGGLKRSLLLQYSYYTIFAFVGAWMGQSLGALWHKFAFLLGFTYLTLSLTITLAWAGVMFEPFSGVLATWVSCLVSLMVADAGQRSEAVIEKEPEQTLAKSTEVKSEYIQAKPEEKAPSVTPDQAVTLAKVEPASSPEVEAKDTTEKKDSEVKKDLPAKENAPLASSNKRK